MFFRWAAFFTFLTGLYLLYVQEWAITTDITLGSLLGIVMMLNVWGIIWRNQKIVIGLKEGDAAAAGAKAGMVSRKILCFLCRCFISWFLQLMVEQLPTQNRIF